MKKASKYETGLILIVLVNILRCTGLAMFAYFNPKVLFFAHHYLFKVMVYGIVFFLWVRFTQINQKNLTRRWSSSAKAIFRL
jgi:exosortase/archaeosortase family protein